MSKDSANRAKFVSFSGVDGAGKSTQIETLRALMEQEGLSVRIITFWDEVACLTKLREGAGHRVFKGDKGVGTPSAPIERRDKNVQTWPMTMLRLGLYFLDAISARLAIRHAMRSGADLVIFDRYIYDELANLPLRNPAIQLFVRLIMSLVFRPNVSFLLDAEPAEARARKPEYPLEFIRANRQNYLELSDLIGGMTVISPKPVDEVKRDVRHYALRALSPKPEPMLANRDDDHADLTGRRRVQPHSESGLRQSRI